MPSTKIVKIAEWLSDSSYTFKLHHMSCIAGTEPTKILSAPDYECMHIYIAIDLKDLSYIIIQSNYLAIRFTVLKT